jgi:hypothetical protein
LNIFKAGADRKARVRKSRLLGFPDAMVFPWSYADFAKMYGKDIIEKSVSAIVLATPEQLAEVKRLFETVKIPEGQEEKWLKQKNVDGWEEMDTDTIAKAIEHIKKTYLNQEKGE